MIDLQAILNDAVAAGRAPGLSAAVVTRTGAQVNASAGVATFGQARPVDADTLFWIASCTKAITSIAAMQLVERGLLDLDAPVGGLLPALASPEVLCGFDEKEAPILRPATMPITLRHLLSHTSGLAYDFACADLARYLKAQGRTLTSEPEPVIPLMFDPGQGWLYGIGIDWAGRLIEAVTGQTLDAYFAEHIFAPLGMNDTTFFPDPAQAARKADVHQKLPGGGFMAIPFGMPQNHHFMMGGGGLYSTANDYLKFLGALLAGGAPLLGEAAFGLVMTDQVGDFEAGALHSAQPSLSHDFVPMPGVVKRWGLAGLINLEPGPAGRSAGSLAWAGLANCYFWADRGAGTAGVLMAQVFPFADPEILETFEAIERGAYA